MKTPIRILVLLILFLCGSTITYTQINQPQRRTLCTNGDTKNNNCGGYNPITRRGRSIINTNPDPNGGYGGYYPGQGPGSTCQGQGCNNTTRQNYTRKRNSNNYQNNYQYYQDDYQNYEYPKPWSFGKTVLFQGITTAMDAGAQYFVQKALIKTAAKEQRKSEEIAYKRQLELLQLQINAQQSQQQPQQPQQQQSYQNQTSGPVQEPLSWTRISITNCLSDGVQLFWNDQPIYFNNSTTLLSMHRVAIEVPQVPGSSIVVVRSDGTFVQKFELRQGLTSLVIR